MSLPNIFTQSVADSVVERINNLTPDSKPLWGKMNPSQMLAHCNVTYEMAFTDKHPKPNPLLKLILKLFVKSKVVGETPFKTNSPTAPQFIIKDERSFEIEKARLIQYIGETLKLGEQAFEGRESLSFGKLNALEWNNMFYKHLDHHLRQFGV